MAEVVFPFRQVKINDDLTLNPRQLWNESSQDYLSHIAGKTDGDGRMVRDEILHPLMLKHLGPTSNKKVLDAGCGDGIISRELKKDGACVVGQDFTFQFAKAATEGDPHIPSLTADVVKLPFLDQSFDKALSNLVLMWVPDIEAPAQEFSRVLRHGGRLVISVTHPLINIGDFDLTDVNRPKLILNESLREGKWLKMINKTNGPYPYYQRSPSAYVNTFTKFGFQLVSETGYDEVYFPDEFVEEHPQYLPQKMFPLFMILAFDKVS